jgi:hypothetical protein
MTQTNQIQTKQKMQYVITDTVETAGAVSYWRLASDTSLATLAAAWKKHGLAEDQLPKPPKDEVALGRAVKDMSEKRLLVRPLARRGAWGIVEETVTERPGLTPRLDHVTLVNVFFRQGQMVVEQAQGTWAQRNDYDTRILAEFSKHRNTLAHNDISSWLLDIAAKLGSVSLRDSGGIYFIPRKEVDIWNKVASALEETGSVIFRIPAMRTAECVAAITDAISAEAATLTQKMEEELLAEGDDALGARALKTRAESAMELLAKLSTYEELIGRQLDIRKRVELLSANITAAALTAETSSESA